MPWKGWGDLGRWSSLEVLRRSVSKDGQKCCHSFDFLAFFGHFLVFSFSQCLLCDCLSVCLFVCPSQLQADFAQTPQQESAYFLNRVSNPSAAKSRLRLSRGWVDGQKAASPAFLNASFRFAARIFNRRFAAPFAVGGQSVTYIITLRTHRFSRPDNCYRCTVQTHTCECVKEIHEWMWPRK